MPNLGRAFGDLGDSCGALWASFGSFVVFLWVEIRRFVLYLSELVFEELVEEAWISKWRFQQGSNLSKYGTVIDFKGFNDFRKNRESGTKTVPKRVDVQRSWRHFGRPWAQKDAKGSEGKV